MFVKDGIAPKNRVMKRLEYLKIAIVATLELVIFWGIVSCSNANGNKEKGIEKQDTITSKILFPFPDIPGVLTSTEDRKDFLLTHYWDKFDFADTTLVNNRDVTEQGFVNFIALLLDGTTTKELTGKSLVDWCTHFLPYPHSRQVMTQLTDDYLYNPNSPYYNETLYGMYLETLLNVLPQTDAMRSSYQFRLELLRRNNVGDKAMDFTYYLPDGTHRTLAATPVKNNRLLLVFYDPECESCHEVLQQMVSDKALAETIQAGKMSVLAVYTEGNDEAWRKSLPDMPQDWTVGTDREAVKTGALYDLKAMPSLYLLDGQKRVILKDATYETVRRTVMQQEP